MNSSINKYSEFGHSKIYTLIEFVHLVKPGDTAILLYQSQDKPTVFDKVTVDRRIAANFLIRDIKIGVDSMLMDSNPIPALALMEECVAPAFGRAVLQIGQIAQISVHNISDKEVYFHGRLYLEPYR